MNCCKPGNGEQQNGQQNGQKNHHGGGQGSHMWMMLLCCGLPLIVLAALPFIDRIIPGSANSIRGIVPLLCPLMMLPMMLGGMREKKEGRPETGLQASTRDDGKPDAESGGH